MIEITAIRLDGGTAHEHITHLQWHSKSSSGLSSREALIEWLNERSENQAVVAGKGECPGAGSGTTRAGAVHSHLRRRGMDGSPVPIATVLRGAG
jgi:hypothetical protein